MADYHNPSSRVGGRMVGRMEGTAVRTNRNLTPEQKEQAERDTQKAYEVWKAQREARLARYSMPTMGEMFPETSGLRHKDIIM